MNKKYCKILILTPLFLSFNVFAQSGEIYKTTDKQGNVYYTDKIPRGEKDVNVLSKKTGIVKSLSELESFNNAQKLNPTELSEIEKVKLQEEEQIRKDQNLINTYSNVEELEKIKSYELDQIKRAISTDDNIISSLENRRKQLEDSVKNTKKKDPEVEKDLAKTLENINNAKKNKEKNTQMLNERTAKYDSEKERLIKVLELIKKEKNPIKVQ